MFQEDFEKFLFPLNREQVLICEELNRFLLRLSGFQRVRKFGVPFYSRTDYVCYLNPILNGGIGVAFPKGYRFEEYKYLLDFAGRKQVGVFVLNNLRDIALTNFHRVMEDAIKIDKEYVQPPVYNQVVETEPLRLRQ